MQKKNFSTLFTVVMILLLIPFIPAFVEGRFNDNSYLDNTADTPNAYIASQEIQTTDYISAGYIGQYGPYATPPAPGLNPRILGVTAQSSGSSPPAYQAQEISRSNYILNLNPGQGFTVWVDFLNTGQTTWHRNGGHFVALNATSPAGRHSPFQHEFWNEYYYRPCRLLQDKVRPGEIGRFRFALLAPATEGTYLEEFHLVAENLTWIDGGFVSFIIGVGSKASRPFYYQAQEVARTKGGLIEVEPGQAFTFEVDFENIGLKNWYNHGEPFIAMNVSAPSGRVSLFKHDFWNEYYYRPARLLQSRIYPGEVGRFRFALQAPNVEGYYNEKFALVAENLSWLPGGEITLNLKVGDPPPPAEPIDYSIEDEPLVRIGLFNTTGAVKITANGAYSLTNINTEKVVEKSAEENTSINYSTDAYWRLVPDDNETIMEITNFNNQPVWNSSLNDNTFRGTIEIRYSEEAEEMWVINELPVESYLKGLAEVANEQPEEYLKALISAARSYILWHAQNGGKHPDTYFDINATTDQVYRGYGFEQRSEDPLLAVQATHGIVITHTDAISQINPQGIAMAAYFSGTDGRTRNWTEVWAGSGFPWLISVDDPYGVLNNWNTLEGNHMVGMSAQGARGYATEKGKTYSWILQHYYTGVEVDKIY